MGIYSEKQLLHARMSLTGIYKEGGITRPPNLKNSGANTKKIEKDI